MTTSSLRVGGGWGAGAGNTGGAFRVWEGLEGLLCPLTFPYILLTLAHIHVDELWPLHAEGEDWEGNACLDAQTHRQPLGLPGLLPACAAPNPPSIPSNPWPPEEGEAALSGYCLGQEGLASARGPMEQEA